MGREGHEHAHPGPRVGGEGRAFMVGIGLNVGFVVVEIVFGVASGSMALVADAGHNLGDVLGLVLAGAATFLARRKPSARRTYGFRRATILAALTNALLLVAATGGIVWESVRRLRQPEGMAAHDALVVSVVALIGVVINGSSALLFRRGGQRDVNQRSAYLHLAADAAVSAGVVVTGALIAWTGFALLDPIASLTISAVILLSTWSLLRRSLDLALDAVPREIDPIEVRAYLAGLPGVAEVHDLHIWAMSSTETALTAHLVTDEEHVPRAEFLRGISGELHRRFHIEHATLQVEPCGAPRRPAVCESPCA
jgi:cobalt-zinc-cadmium efflux system protein